MMNTTIPFIKMHGLGNDFVIIHQLDLHEQIMREDFVTKVAHRKLGAGCDQLMIYKRVAQIAEQDKNRAANQVWHDKPDNGLTQIQQSSDWSMMGGQDQKDNFQPCFEMQIYNQDVTIAQACGNASRCISRLVFEGVNVNFATVEDNKICLRVWERGTGLTYACGSGAIATFAAAHKIGFVEDNAEIVFEYGSLGLQFIDNKILMSGAAEYVYSGELYV